jgi:tight adherence protein B
MSLLGGLCAGAAVFLVVAHLGGHGRHLRLRKTRRARRPSMAVRLRQAGVAVSPAQFVAATAAVALAVWVLVWGLSGSGFVAAVPAAVAGVLPWAYFSRRRSARLAQVVAAWPDGIRHLLANARAHGSLHQALVELARSGPEPLRDAFGRYSTLARMAGPTQALEVIREELAEPTSDRVLEVLMVALERGQLLAMRILRDLASIVSEDLKALEEINSAGLEQRIDVRATFVIPWALLVALCASAAAYRDFYRGPGGALVVAAGALMSVAGMALVERLRRLPAERRVLGAAAGAPR